MKLCDSVPRLSLRKHGPDETLGPAMSRADEEQTECFNSATRDLVDGGDESSYWKDIDH